MQNFIPEVEEGFAVAQFQRPFSAEDAGHVDIRDDTRRTGREHDDAIRQEHRLLHVMRHENDRLRVLGLNPAHLELKLLAPLRFPSAIYCAGANYGDHAAEMAAKEGNPPPPDPHALGHKAWHFLKAAGAITDPGATVKISNYAKNMDWEIEMAAVIGKTGKDIPQSKALSYVAGYTIANDLSARDRGRRAGVPDASPFKWDWTKHKTFEGSCPLGPWIVPASDIGDPQKLGLKLWVNGVLKQDSNTSDMIFNLAEQIEQLSAGMTLYPGDLILTGTPAGVGAGRGEFLKAGDVVKLWVEKIGEIENRMA